MKQNNQKLEASVRTLEQSSAEGIKNYTAKIDFLANELRVQKSLKITSTAPAPVAFSPASNAKSGKRNSISQSTKMMDELKSVNAELKQKIMSLETELNMLKSAILSQQSKLPLNNREGKSEFKRSQTIFAEDRDQPEKKPQSFFKNSQQTLTPQKKNPWDQTEVKSDSSFKKSQQVLLEHKKHAWDHKEVKSTNASKILGQKLVGDATAKAANEQSVRNHGKLFPKDSNPKTTETTVISIVSDDVTAPNHPKILIHGPKNLEQEFVEQSIILPETRTNPHFASKSCPDLTKLCYPEMKRASSCDNIPSPSPNFCLWLNEYKTKRKEVLVNF